MSTVIITVTPNPGLDLTYVLPGGLVPDVEVHRARSATLEASGKGVNVSRALASVGRPTVALLFSAGATGRQLLELLTGEGVEHRAVHQDGVTRVNTSVLGPGGTTKVNAPGAVMTAADFDNLVVTLDDELATQSGTGWVLICGSLPPIATSAELDVAGVVQRLIGAAHARNWRVAVDSSGAALVAAAEAGADLLTPNAGELTALLPGFETAPDEEALHPVETAAAEVARQHACELLVSLGPDGALWTDGTRSVHAVGPAVEPVNTAGAGDALLSGWFCHPELDVAERLATAVLWGAAACLAPTTVRIPAAPEDAVPSDVVVRERAYPAGAPS